MPKTSRFSEDEILSAQGMRRCGCLWRHIENVVGKGIKSTLEEIARKGKEVIPKGTCKETEAFLQGFADAGYSRYAAHKVANMSWRSFRFLAAQYPHIKWCKKSNVK